MRRFASSKRNFVSWRTRCVVYSRHVLPSSKTSQSRRKPSRSTPPSVWVYARRCRWIPRLARYLYFHQFSARSLARLCSIDTNFSTVFLFTVVFSPIHVLPPVQCWEPVKPTLHQYNFSVYCFLLGRPERQFRMGLCFSRDVIFSTLDLRAPLADRRETSPHGGKLAEFYNAGPKIPLSLKHQNNFGAKNMRNFGQFCTTSDFDRGYLRNEATYPKIVKLHNLERFLLRLTKKKIR